MRQSGKLGPILIQTPPNLKADLDLLRTFAQLLAQAYRFAFEFRHESWFTDAVYEILKSKNAALCWAESEKIVVPKVVTADFVYYRFREPEYSTPDLQKVAEELKEQGAEREVFAFFKHEEQPESALNAVTVARVNGIEEKPFVMPEKKGRRRIRQNRSCPPSLLLRLPFAIRLRRFLGVAQEGNELYWLCTAA